MVTGSTEVVITLNVSRAAAGFVAMLPLELVDDEGKQKREEMRW